MYNISVLFWTFFHIWTPFPCLSFIHFDSGISQRTIDCHQLKHISFTSNVEKCNKNPAKRCFLPISRNCTPLDRDWGLFERVTKRQHPIFGFSKKGRAIFQLYVTRLTAKMGHRHFGVNGMPYVTGVWGVEKYAF